MHDRYSIPPWAGNALALTSQSSPIQAPGPRASSSERWSLQLNTFITSISNYNNSVFYNNSYSNDNDFKAMLVEKEGGKEGVQEGEKEGGKEGGNEVEKKSGKERRRGRKEGRKEGLRELLRTLCEGYGPHTRKKVRHFESICR